jgi:uncharacterized protein with von Willebrand factor type A (vWA) domain
VIDHLTGFVGELRSAGLPVSLTEALDATAAVAHVRLEDREAFRTALAATLVKSAGHRAAFDTVFDVWFCPTAAGRSVGADGDGDGGPAAVLDGPGADPGPADGGGPRASTEDGEPVSDGELADMLERAMAGAGAELLEQVARQAVARYAGMEPGRAVGGSYYLYRTLRHLDLDGVVERLLAAAQDESGEPGAPGDDLLRRRLAREELELRADRLRAEVEAEIRRRLVADRGPRAVARTLRRPLPDQVDFMHATAAELAALHRAVYPLTRKLAARLARRRRHGRKGPLDFRSTMRHSLSTGGVPADPRFRRPRATKPEIMVVADISGSVAAFARFTLQLVYAMSSQFSQVRSFVFIDGVDEVTHLFEGADDIAEALRRVNTEADVVWADGHSDYGHALEELWRRWGTEVGPRTSVIILGDARNNYHAASAWVVAELAARARHLYWLNPEPRSYWDTGDSVVGQYAAHCDGAYECRNLAQLAGFVEQLG